MKKIINGVLATALAGSFAISSALPAQAQSFSFSIGTTNQRDRVIERYCDSHRWDRDCRSYRSGGWRDRDYNRFYSSRRGNLDSIASGLFGFTFGAILGSAIANSANSGSGNNVVIRNDRAWDAHVDRCETRFRSYDVASDTYLGYDGIRHPCRL